MAPFFGDLSQNEKLPEREDAQGFDLAPFFGDLSQREKLSEIKLPLDQFEVELYEQQLPS